MKFETGRTYYGRFIGDADLTEKFEILKRSEKQVTVKSFGEIVKRKVFTHNGIEYFLPHGNYSMALSVYANRIV